MVIEHGGPQLAGQGEELVHRLRGQALGLGQLATQSGRRLLDRGPKAERDRREGLVDLIVEVLRDAPSLALLGPDRGPAGLATLGLETTHHAVEGGVEARDLRILPARRVVLGSLRGREIDLLHQRDHAFERFKAAPKQQPVAEQCGQQGQASTSHSGPRFRFPELASTTSVATSIVPATSRRLTARTCARRERAFMTENGVLT